MCECLDVADRFAAVARQAAPDGIAMPASRPLSTEALWQHRYYPRTSTIRVIWHERLGKSADEIATEYDLTLSNVYAALAYYFDNREAIDESIAKSKALVASLREKNVFRLAKRIHETTSHGEDPVLH